MQPFFHALQYFNNVLNKILMPLLNSLKSVEATGACTGHHLCNHPSGIKKMDLFFINATKDWNSLPDNVKGERSKVNFKGSLKTHLFNDAKSRHMNEYV